MRESQDHFTSHRIGLVPCFIDRKPGRLQQIEERLGIGALSEDKEIHVVSGAWSSPDTEG